MRSFYRVIAIKSGEAWVVEEEIVETLVPLKNGQIKIFNWKSHLQKSEQWYDFVERSIKEALNLLNQWNLEKSVRSDLAGKIWYHFELTEE